MDPVIGAKPFLAVGISVFRETTGAMLFLRQTSKAAFLSAGLGAALCAAAVWTTIGKANADSIGPRNTSVFEETGELLEPSSIQPMTTPLTANDRTDEPAILRDIPAPTLEMYENLTAQLAETRNKSGRIQSQARTAEEAMFGLPISFTASEWMQQWAELGYWLENDQWADFQAIALAGYLPEIRYWLGGDRWATFRSNTFGTRFSGSSSKIDGSARGGQPAIAGYGGGHGRINGLGTGKKRGMKVGDTPESFQDLLLSMVKKMAKEPLFYFILACGAAAMMLAFRRQSVR